MNIYKHEKLKEAFDLFARLQNEQLPDEEALSSITFSSDFEMRMRKVLKKQKYGFYVLFGTVGRRVASIVAAVLLAMTVTTVSVDALREPVVQFLTQIFETFTQVFIVDDTPETSEVTFEKRAPGYIPEGYELKQETDLGTMYKIVYTNAEGNVICYSQRWKESNTAAADTENVEATEIRINGLQGMLYQNKGTMSVIFTDNYYSYSLSGMLSTDELIKIAETIQ